jgi:hypothetical protein
VPPPPAGPWAWRGERTDGREWFCHSICIIMGVTLFYVGGGFIARVSSVTAVSILLRPHTFSVRLLILFASPPRAYIPSSSVSHSSSLPRQPHIQLLFGSHRPGSCVHWNWESRPPERLPSSSSPTRVKDDNHVFGECRWRHDYSLDLLLPRGSLVIGTISLLHCIERDDYIDRHYVFKCIRLCRWI